MATLSERLGGFVFGLSSESIPAGVRRRARHLILDAIGCALAGRRFEFASRALAGIAGLAGQGPRAVIGHAERLPIRDAALANGLLAHGLDYDDTHSEAIAHFTASVFPAALAVAAELGKSGRELLAAYVAGVEAGARIGAAARGGFHDAGFHPTGVVGAFACALAAGKLYGLDPTQLAHAQGIALSLAGGSLQFIEDGAWTKRLHPGWAAASGIAAAVLAKEGFVAPLAAYEGRHGLYANFLGALKERCDLSRITRGLGEDWETLNVAVKPFPACHFVHAFADCAIALRREGADPDGVRSITARVPSGIVAAVCEPAANKRRPVSGYDARFSLPYVAAASLRAGKFGIEELEPAALADSATLALADRVGYEIDPEAEFPRYYGGELVLRMADGRQFRHRERVNRGNAERPLGEDEVQAKFLENAGFAVSERRARELMDAVLELENRPARVLEDVLGER